MHVLTTRLAKTHGRIVVEGLDAAGMLRRKGCRVPALGGVDCPMPPWAHRGGTCLTRQAGTGHNSWSPTGGSRRRKPATFVGMFRTSVGLNIGNAIVFGSAIISGMTTPL